MKKKKKKEKGILKEHSSQEQGEKDLTSGT